MRIAASWLIAAALIAAGGYWLAPAPEIVQPIDISHEKHLLAKRAEGPITCATCHKFFKTRRMPQPLRRRRERGPPAR